MHVQSPQLSRLNNNRNFRTNQPALAMKPLTFSSRSRAFLLLVSILGFTVPNGVFLWFAFTQFSAISTTLTDPVALVFIVEAFVLMFLLAWLVHRSGARPGWLAFIVMSLIGSLAFSVPAWLWLASRETSSQ
jgi:hypothetical protein